MRLKLTILGCGNSDGVPATGNHWGKCNPHEARNRRSRASIVIQSDATTLLIDSTPDVRMQINGQGIEKIDALIYTHPHADHVNGIDDIRAYAKRRKDKFPIYTTAETMAELKERFPHQFTQLSPLYPVLFAPHVIAEAALCRSMNIGDIEFIPFPQIHGGLTSLGFRFGDVAYSTDLADLEDRSVEVLKGVDTWIVDAAGYKMPRNSAHFTLEKLYSYQERIVARRVIMTHLTPGMDYQTLMDETPDNFEPAYDGMEISL